MTGVPDEHEMGELIFHLRSAINAAGNVHSAGFKVGGCRNAWMAWILRCRETLQDAEVYRQVVEKLGEGADSR